MGQWKGDHAKKLINADKVLVKGCEDNFSCVALCGNSSGNRKTRINIGMLVSNQIVDKSMIL